jgi:diguanylate cyclase (GGDEF)-like protein
VLRLTFRNSDVIARIGGDEFAVLCESPGESYTSLEERLLSTLKARSASRNRGYEIALSVGVALCDPATEMVSIDSLLQRADKTMYEKKKARHSSAV